MTNFANQASLILPKGWKLHDNNTISPSDSAFYAHTDLSHITTEQLELPVVFTDGRRHSFSYERLV